MNATDFNVGDTVWYVEDLWENVETHKATVAFKTQKCLVVQSKDGYCYNLDVELDTNDGCGLFMFNNELDALKKAKLLIEKQLKGLAEDARSYAKQQMTVEKLFVKQVDSFQKRIDKLSKKAK